MNEKRYVFLKGLLKGINIFRLIVINIVFFVFLLAFLGILGNAGGKEKRSVKVFENSILLIQPEGIVSEVKDEFEWVNVFFPEKEKSILLSDLVSAIKNAAADYRIKALCFNLSGLSGLSSAHFSELAAVVRAFKKSGKPVYAYASSYSVPDYYLASFADKIGIDPLGSVELTGFSSQALFFKGMEEKFGIHWNVIQAGGFKSMAESYSRTSMSENVRANLTEMLTGLWDSYISDIAENRSLPQEVFRNFSENNYAVLKKYDGDSAAACLSEKLVTEIAEYPDFQMHIEDELAQSLGGQVSWVEYQNYAETFLPLNKYNKIALINLTGAITSEKRTQSPANAAVADEISKLFEDAASDSKVRAVVLRVDSGGGEVFASEKIRRSVIETSKKKNIPVVVSMGSVAASGAYWISSAADYVFASPYTITGSIGVLAVVPSFEDMLKDKLGITVDAVYAGQKPVYSVLKNKTQEDMELLKLNIMHVYKLFIQKVADGRNLPFDTAANLAGGRIYSGKQALQLKLIDKLGTLSDAAEYAASLAGVQDSYYVEEISKELTPMKKILNSMSSGQSFYTNFVDLKAAAEFLNLKSEKGIYLYSPERLMWVK